MRGLLFINREIKVLKTDGECEIETTIKKKSGQLLLYTDTCTVTIMKWASSFQKYCEECKHTDALMAKEFFKIHFYSIMFHNDKLLLHLR